MFLSHQEKAVLLRKQNPVINIFQDRVIAYAYSVVETIKQTLKYSSRYSVSGIAAWNVNASHLSNAVIFLMNCTLQTFHSYKKYVASKF